MTTRAATANGLTKGDAYYLARIDECVREIDAIRKNIARKRAEGRKVSANIRRQQKEIQTILTRVEAAL
ncbi:MAG: hypothetical protein HYY24_05030 [Verrucomicrobia bacterium]|nr:hypothetical protein [Verrucomicrobiota bacterium]